MTTALVVIILLAVAYVAYDIARITARCAEYGLRGDERAAPELADQPSAEDEGQPAKGMGH